MSDFRSQIIARAWKDEAFKQRLLKDPRSIFQEMGIPVPEGMEIKILEETENTEYLVIPSNPAGSNLSEEALDQISGGGPTTPSMIARWIMLVEAQARPAHSYITSLRRKRVQDR